MLRKEVIQVISELGQAKSFVQAENNLDYLIRDDSVLDSYEEQEF